MPTDKTDSTTHATSATPTQAPAPAPIASKSYYAFFVVYMAMLSAFGSFVNDMYLPTLPAMMKAFHTSVTTTELGLTFGMIGLGAGEFFFGPATDKYGRKPIMVGALILFCIAAAVSTFSPTIYFFLWCRLVQGLGASAGYFLARTMPADLYAGRQLAKVMALVGAINGFAPATAPVIGGLVSRSIGWRGIFWILFAFCCALLAASFHLRETLPKSRRSQRSLLSTFGNYLILCRSRRFIIHVFLKGSALGVLFAYISAAPFIIQTHYGFSALDFGLFMGFNSLFVVTGSMVALRFPSLRRAAYAGAWILLGACLLQSAQLFLFDSVWVFEGCMLPMLFALGILFTAGNTLAMNDGRAYAGGASAIVGLVGYAFGAGASPLVGLGDIMHSTAYVFIVLAAITLVFAILSRRLPAETQTEHL